MAEQKVWIITGASQGLGLATVKHLLSRQQIVIATTRDRAGFEKKTGLTHPDLEVIGLDITSEDAVAAAVAEVYKTRGRIDVLINNAGFGHMGAVEEATQEEIGQVFEINVYASLRMIRQVLPYMRAARSGHIFNLSSIGGFAASPGFGIYNATKFAVEGFSEALYQEVGALGIHVTIIEPGYFRTNFLDHSLAVSGRVIDDYAGTAGKTRSNRDSRNGKQQGNPDLAAKAIFEIANSDEPPLRLLLGEDAYQRATKKLDDTRAEFERIKSVTLSTAYEDA